MSSSNFRDMVTGGSGDPYAQNLYINKRASILKRLETTRKYAKKSRREAWVKRMKEKGYTVDASGIAYRDSGGELLRVQSFDDAEKGIGPQNEIGVLKTQSAADLDAKRELSNMYQSKVVENKDPSKKTTVEDEIEERDLGQAVGVEAKNPEVGSSLMSNIPAVSKEDQKKIAELQPEKESNPTEYKDILKMKRGKLRDELTIKHWSDKGYDLSGFKGQDMRRLANDLRIGHANEMSGSAGTFLHINPAFRGAGTTIKKKVKGG
jgi:hypothetical protein